MDIHAQESADGMAAVKSATKEIVL
jgi:hypothetical protein